MKIREMVSNRYFWVIVAAVALVVVVSLLMIWNKLKIAPNSNSAPPTQVEPSPLPEQVTAPEASDGGVVRPEKAETTVKLEVSPAGKQTP